jgi:hypothetical protein
MDGSNSLQVDSVLTGGRGRDTTTAVGEDSAPVSDGTADADDKGQGDRDGDGDDALTSLIKEPERVLVGWAEACYAEAAALELEERVLRRLAGQCGLQLPAAPYRFGTRYLREGGSRPGPGSRSGGAGAGLCAGAGLSGSSLGLGFVSSLGFKDGVQFTAGMLWDRMRARAGGRTKIIATAAGAAADKGTMMVSVPISVTHPSQSLWSRDGQGAPSSSSASSLFATAAAASSTATVSSSLGSSDYVSTSANNSGKGNRRGSIGDAAAAAGLGLGPLGLG